MKKFFRKFLCIFAFILLFMGSVFAADLSISSVVYDNSASFLSINSKDFDRYDFQAPPKLYVNNDERIAYFDINSAFLNASTQDIVINSAEIKEIIVKQYSTNPNIVRVQISYAEGFNPKNIQLKRLNNSLFVRFSTAQIQNYYFNYVYTDSVSSINPFYEPVSLQVPLQLAATDILSQINSAFQLGASTEDTNYILTKKDLYLPTKYYIDNVNIKNGAIQINGIGSVTLTKPFTLTNPQRQVYDIPNTVVNPSIRNKEYYISQTETVKIGQFDKSTARIVITSKYADKYLPVMSPDGQNFEFVDIVTGKRTAMNNYPKSTFNGFNGETVDKSTRVEKMFFSRPVVYGYDRNSSGIDFYFYNVDKYGDMNFKSSPIFENAKLSAITGGGYKLSIPLHQGDIVDLHAGNDGKTLRMKLKSAYVPPPPPPAPEEPVITVPSVVITLPTRPANGKPVIVIDPGHGGSDCGATRSGIYEKDITLDVSKKVYNMLTKKGYDVYMTREGDETVSLQERVDISENIQPDVFVSIHVNSSTVEAPNGLETHYYKDNSLSLAKTVHASMLNHIKANNRGLFKSKFYVINHTTAPAILVEIGFISNASERAQLVSESRKQATAKAIAEGIDGYFK